MAVFFRSYKYQVKSPPPTISHQCADLCLFFRLFGHTHDDGDMLGGVGVVWMDNSSEGGSPVFHGKGGASWVIEAKRLKFLDSESGLVSPCE